MAPVHGMGVGSIDRVVAVAGIVKGMETVETVEAAKDKVVIGMSSQEIDNSWEL